MARTPDRRVTQARATATIVASCRVGDGPQRRSHSFGARLLGGGPAQTTPQVGGVGRVEVEVVDEEAAGQRRPGEERDAVVGAPVEHAVGLGVAHEQRVLVLDDADRTNRQRPLHQVDRVVRQAGDGDGSLVHELHQRLPRRLDRRRRVGVVDLDGVEDVDAEAGAAGVDVGADRVAAVILARPPVLTRNRPALREDRRSRGQVADRLADDLLRPPPSIERRSVDERDSGPDGGADRRDGNVAVLRSPPQRTFLQRSERRRAESECLLRGIPARSTRMA